MMKKQMVNHTIFSAATKTGMSCRDIYSEKESDCRIEQTEKKIGISHDRFKNVMVDTAGLLTSK